MTPYPTRMCSLSDGVSGTAAVSPPERLEVEMLSGVQANVPDPLARR